jgi:hypothetical protein
MADDMEKFDVFGEEPKGPLATKHKILLRAVGYVLVWLGKAFIHAESYERVTEICKGMDQKSKRIQELADKMDDLSEEEVKQLSQTIQDGG